MKRFKWLVFFLSIFLLPWNFPASVGATLSKTILVKGLNGSVYQGALVKAIWFTDSDDGSSSIITTGADGSAQISYNSAATYGYLIVQPASGDTTHAIGLVERFTTFSSSTIEYTLKRADAQVSILTSANEAAPIGSTLTMWKSTFTILRTGAFGINGDDITSLPGQSTASVSPPSDVTNQYSDYRYYTKTKTDSGWSFKFYSDSALSQQVSAVAGVNILKFRSTNVQFTLKNSDNSALSLTSEEYVYLSAERVRSNGENPDYFYDYVEGRVASNGNWQGAFSRQGEYRLTVVSSGVLKVPHALVGSVWVDAQGRVSRTQSGTYAETLTTDLVLPAINLKVDLLDGEVANEVLAYKASIFKKIGGEYTPSEGMISGVESPNGKAAFSLGDGDYEFTFNTYSVGRPTTKYYVNVSGATVAVTDSAGTSVSPTDGVYRLRTSAAKVKLRFIDNGVAIPYTKAYAINNATKSYVDFNGDANGYSFSSPADGTYELSVIPRGTENPPRAQATYSMVIASGVVSSIRSTETGATLAATNGIYSLGLSTPNVTIQLKLQGTAPSQGNFSGSIIRTTPNQFGDVLSVGFNSNVTAGAKLSAGKYRFSPQDYSNPGNLYAPSQECEVPSTGTVNCVVDYPAVNFTFSVKDQNDQLLYTNYYASLYQILEDGNQLNAQNSFPNSETGKIRGRMFDGNYRLDISPNDPSNGMGGRTSYRITVASGIVSRVFNINSNQDVTATNGEYALNLQKLNFKVQIKSGGQNVTSANITTYKTLKGDEDRQWAYTNSQGIANLYLSDGEHVVFVRPNDDLSATASETTFKVKVLNSNIERVEKKDGTEITATSGTYQLTLDSPNVTGKVQIGGVNANSYGGYIYAYKLATDGNYFTGGPQSRIDDDGDFALKLDLGTYVFSITLYNPYQQFMSGLCEITSTSTNTCSITLPAKNLEFDVFTPTSVNVFDKVYANINSLFDNSGKAVQISIPNPQSATQKFSTSLLDGNYELILSPNQQVLSEWVYNIYTFTVANGAITQMKDRKQQVVNPTNGIFALSLNAPTVSGTIVATDGTSPYPNGSINIQSEREGFGFGSDASGKFGAFLEKDGNYEIWATPNSTDTQFYDSERRSFTVTNGQVSNQIVLRLRKPNVSGTVRGPTGTASAYNWINPRKKNADGYFEYIPKVSGRSSNALGLFTMYLEPGIYKFEAQADLAAKGSRTLSGECVVEANVDKVCDITLSAANLKIKVTDGSGALLDGAYGYFYVTQAATRPTKDWEWVNIDLTGNGRVFLDDAIWNLQLSPPWNNSNVSQSNFSITVSNGAVTAITDSAGTAITPNSDGVYTLVLPGANLIGDIKFNNVRVNHWNQVVVKRKQGDYFYEITSRGSGDGKFGFKVSPGIYQIEARPQFGFNTDRTTSRSAICEVVADVVKTCDVSLRAPNFNAKVSTSTGAIFNDASIYLYTVNTQSEKGGENWEYGIDLNQGNFGAYLEDGVYRISVQPYWQYRASYSAQDYQVTVATVNQNKVITVVNKLTNATVNAVDGRFPLVLGTPAVRGTVLMPGTSTETVPNIQIVPIDSQGRERWEYQVQSDAQGKFGITIPDGTWTLWARTWGSGRVFTNSTKVQVQVTSGALVPAGEITIRLRAPNIYGTIIKPGGGTAVPLSDIDVNIYMNGEYYYARTNEQGQFGAYIEGAIPNSCGESCSIYLSTWRSTEYTSKRYTFSALGDLGNLTMGAVSTVVTVLQPNGGSTTPNKWGYVAVEEFDGTNYIWQPGMHTNELGKVGLSLTATKKYRLTAYPNWEREGEFAPKSVVINEFSATDNATISITFDTPNFTFINKDRLGNLNSWGWYEVYKLNTGVTPNVYEFLKNGRLDQQGKGSQFLENGTYQFKFWPSGKAIGITKTETVEVVAGAVTGGTSRIVTLPTGNVSGVITKGGVAVAGASVAAVADTDATKIVSTVTLSDGTYELSLDMSRSWTVKALDPISTAVGQISLALVTGGNSETQLTGKNIAVTVP